MEPDTIPISELADFDFCPKSVYYHHIYARFDQSLYHERAQVEGKLAHETVDRARYSTKKRWLQGMPVASRKYGIYGKIDLFDQDTGTLIERKNLLKKPYRGNRYQLYGQYYCLREMGYDVKRLKIHSLRDNKTYEIPVPNLFEETYFISLLDRIRRFGMGDFFIQNPKKCIRCVYRQLCDTGL